MLNEEQSEEKGAYMGRQEFKVSSGAGIVLLAILLGIFNLGIPVALIVSGILRWDGIGPFIGMCVLALIAFIVFGIPTLMLMKSVLSYLKVDGDCFFVREGLHTKYTATCADLKKVHCHKEKSLKGHVASYISLTFRNKDPYSIPSGQKNFKRLAKYFCEMEDTGGIADEVISPKNRDILQQYSEGDFSCIRKRTVNEKKAGIGIENDSGENRYSVCIEVTKIRDKEFLKMLIPLFVWPVIVMTALLFMVKMPKHYSDITGPIFFLSILLIIPILIVLVKKAKKFRETVVFEEKELVFEVIGDTVLMDGKKVKITVNTVSKCFNLNTSKLEGYIVKPGNTKEFRAFLDKNAIPYNEYGNNES